MINILLIIIPLCSGLALFFIRNDFIRRNLIVVCSGAHLALTCLTWLKKLNPVSTGWFMFDNVSIIFLTITSILFFGASVYAVRYLADESLEHPEEPEKPRIFSREAVFSGCFLLFLATMTIVIASQHLAVLWVGVEATTLASAPLIYFHRTKRSLEATWKYLLICSVGIAMALLGIFFLAVANNNQSDLLLAKIIAHAAGMNIPWLKAAFLLLFVGYGTKMGIAPFHTWLPDAHSEAPSVVSALLSGALLNCAFLGILRVYQICIAAGLQAYCQEIFMFFGLLSIVFAAVFILKQPDYKRMLAYSSVEHMGIITLGIGLGNSAVFGAMVNMIGHALTKAGLFFIAGNILSYFKTKKIGEIQGLIRGQMQWSGILWLVGFLLITGTPPSGIFFGKFIILKQALLEKHYVMSFIFLGALAIVFIGMARIFISMTQGPAIKTAGQGDLNKHNRGNAFLRLVPSALFFGLAISLGVYFPAWLSRALAIAAKELGGL
ncbi:MAG: proton-conducting transporter membrane subunit [Candidatus Omnitrophota bacterium]